MYPQDTLSSVRDQLDRVSDYELYSRKFEEADVEFGSIETWEDFRQIPFTTSDELKKDFDERSPEGSLYPGNSTISFTPLGEGLAPVFDPPPDLEYMVNVNSDVFERAGIEPGHRVLNTFGYHTFGTGYVFHRALEELGAEVIPAGPGDSEQAAQVIQDYGVDALLGNPSYALKIADKGGTGIDVFVGGGEPFTSIPGMRDKVKEAFGGDITAVDYFGTRWFLPVAVECRGEHGLHVIDDFCVVEVIDPDTGEVLPEGERGEIVVTHVNKKGSPLVRFRTGDLAELQVEECETCGARVTMPRGVIGRTDQRLKVKGVKVYPESLGTVLAGFQNLTGNYRIEVTRPESTDHLKIICEGDADVDKLHEALSRRLIVSPDEIELVDELEEGDLIVDRRY